MTRLALLGGSFDPVHNGHLHIAREILKSGLADKIVFLPNACHNFKRGSVTLDFENRYALVEACLEPGMEAWPDDSAGSGYTADLIRRLRQKLPSAELLWVIGSDNLSSLPRWHDFSWLRANVRFLVIPRPGYPLEDSLLRKIRRKVLRIDPSPVSSTLVRQRLAQGLSISELVPRAIEEKVREFYTPLLNKNA